MRRVLTAACRVLVRVSGADSCRMLSPRDGSTISHARRGSPVAGTRPAGPALVECVTPAWPTGVEPGRSWDALQRHLPVDIVPVSNVRLKSIVSSGSEQLATLDEVISNDAWLLFGIQRDRDIKRAPGSSGWQSLSQGLQECPVQHCCPRPKVRIVSPEVSQFISFGEASGLYLWMSA